MERLDTVLSGQLTIQLHLQFLIRNNHSDLVILKQVKDVIRNSVSHNATIIANALMHCGTTSDLFLRYVSFMCNAMHMRELLKGLL